MATGISFDVLGFFTSGFIAGIINWCLVITFYGGGGCVNKDGKSNQYLDCDIILGFTMTYASILPIFGQHQMRAPMIYATNLKYFSGGNHYLVWTAK
jgi:hypothetical protein